MFSIVALQIWLRINYGSYSDNFGRNVMVGSSPPGLPCHWKIASSGLSAERVRLSELLE